MASQDLAAGLVRGKIDLVFLRPERNALGVIFTSEVYVSLHFESWATTMDDLLAFAIEAHGGLQRWNAFANLDAELSVDGAIWRLKQQAGLLKDKVFTIKTHEERLTISPFGGPDQRCVFAADRLTLETFDGVPVEARDQPENAFVGHQRETPWDKFHVAYFASEALWIYLTSPFL